MGKSRIVAEDRRVQLCQPGARLDAELVYEHRAGGAVCLERLGLSFRTVERRHQQPARPLAERMVRHEPLERRDHIHVTSQCKLRLHPPLERQDAQLLEARDHRTQRRLVREVGERGPAPEPERLGEGCGGGGGILPLERDGSRVGEALEPLEVEGVPRDVEHVAGAPGLDRVPAECLAEPRDVPLDEVRRRCRRVLPPKAVHESRCRDDSARLAEEEREHRALLRAAEARLPSVDDRLERAEEAVDNLHRPTLLPMKPMSAHGAMTGGTGAKNVPVSSRQARPSGAKMHRTRHNAGQRVLDATHNLKAVQALLGHASISTIADTYTDWDVQQLESSLLRTFTVEDDGE